jgi:hypothetical protein
MTVRLQCPSCGCPITVRVAAAVDEQARAAQLVDLVVSTVTEHGPISGRALRKTLARRRADVRTALTTAEAAGRIRDTEDGWIAC